jgi:hypothetical protein
MATMVLQWQQWSYNGQNGLTMATYCVKVKRSFKLQHISKPKIRNTGYNMANDGERPTY